MRFALASLLVIPFAAACTVTSESPPPPAPVVSDGTLTVDWTIDESKDPNLCNQSRSTTIEVQVFFSGGGSAGTFQQSCDAMATSISLTPGDYDATAVLLDGAGGERTTAIAIDPFTIHPGGELTIPIDFPADSFH